MVMDRDNLLSLLGVIPAKAELDLRVIEKVDCGIFIRKKIVYSAEVRETIIAFLCIPKGSFTPLPAIYCFNQHVS